MLWISGQQKSSSKIILRLLPRHWQLEIADRGYVLANGRVELKGSAADLRASPEIQDAYLGA